MKKTALYQEHIELHAKMVDFGGWQMPLQYTGILEEHKAVRENAGLFDVSHMARVAFKGKEAAKFADYISTHHLKESGKAVYTCLCNEQGGTVDDVLIYKESDESLFCVLNASRRESDLEHLYKVAQNFDVTIEECFHHEGILALQGPLVADYFPLVKPMRFERRGDMIVSGTGYTGSGGVEIFAPTESIVKLWKELIAQGVTPIGLGARDTLRLEKGYALYGHELSETISPIESVSKWTVSLDKDFLGKQALSQYSRHAYGVKLLESSIPRQGFEVFKEGQSIGTVTSGGFSPSLKIPIALILVKESLEENELIEIEIRGKKVAGTVVALPFLGK